MLRKQPSSRCQRCTVIVVSGDVKGFIDYLDHEWLVGVNNRLSLQFLPRWKVGWQGHGIAGNNLV